MYELYQTYSSAYWWIVPVFLSLSFPGLCIGSRLVRAAYEYVLEVNESKGIYKIFCEKYIVPKIGDERWGYDVRGDFYMPKKCASQYLPWFFITDTKEFGNFCFFFTFFFSVPFLTFLVLVAWKFEPMIVITLFTIAPALLSMRWCVRKFKSVSARLETHIKDKGAHS